MRANLQQAQSCHFSKYTHFREHRENLSVLCGFTKLLIVIQTRILSSAGSPAPSLRLSF